MFDMPEDVIVHNLVKHLTGTLLISRAEVSGFRCIKGDFPLPRVPASRLGTGITRGWCEEVGGWRLGDTDLSE